VDVPAGIERLFSRAMYAVTGKLAHNPASYASLQQDGQIPIPLPTLALYLFLPFFNAMRVWARFGLPVSLVVAVLAGIGASALLSWRRWTPRSRVIIGVALMAAIVLDFLSAPFAFGMSRVGAQPVDEWLRQQPGDFAILTLPEDKTWHGPALYAQREHGKKIAYGYGTFMPPDYQAWREQISNFPDDASLDAIKAAGVRYIVVGLRSYGDREQEMKERLSSSSRLRQVFQSEERPVFSGDRLVDLVDSSPLVPPTDLIGRTRYADLVDDVAVYEIVP
jgi:hypothetical protein